MQTVVPHSRQEKQLVIRLHRCNEHHQDITTPEIFPRAGLVAGPSPVEVNSYRLVPVLQRCDASVGGERRTYLDEVTDKKLLSGSLVDSEVVSKCQLVPMLQRCDAPNNGNVLTKSCVTINTKEKNCRKRCRTMNGKHDVSTTRCTPVGTTDEALTQYSVPTSTNDKPSPKQYSTVDTKNNAYTTRRTMIDAKDVVVPSRWLPTIRLQRCDENSATVEAVDVIHGPAYPIPGGSRAILPVPSDWSTLVQKSSGSPVPLRLPDVRRSACSSSPSRDGDPDWSLENKKRKGNNPTRKKQHRDRPRTARVSCPETNRCGCTCCIGLPSLTMIEKHQAALLHKEDPTISFLGTSRDQPSTVSRSKSHDPHPTEVESVSPSVGTVCHTDSKSSPSIAHNPHHTEGESLPPSVGTVCHTDSKSSPSIAHNSHHYEGESLPPSVGTVCHTDSKSSPSIAHNSHHTEGESLPPSVGTVCHTDSKSSPSIAHNSHHTEGESLPPSVGTGCRTCSVTMRRTALAPYLDVGVSRSSPRTVCRVDSETALGRCRADGEFRSAPRTPCRTGSRRSRSTALDRCHAAGTRRRV